MPRFVLGLSLLIGFSIHATGLAAADAPAAAPLAQAHAHNDYLHKRPLLDALDHGFTSVEADIFLVKGQLLVAHTKYELSPKRTLQALYLDPLRERVKANGGSVLPGLKTFHLLVDIKSDAETTYAELAKVLAQYADIVSVVRDGKLEPKAVEVVISGSRPVSTMTGESVRYAGIDGRTSDLDSDAPVHLMPLVSDSWTSQFKWKGQGEMPEAERTKLADAVSRAHAKGRRLRYWATPETQDLWRTLQAAGVDHINTDKLAELEAFLRQQPPAKN